MRSALLVCVLAAACNGEHAYHDGPICLDVDALRGFAPGDPLEVRVVLDDCISACAREVHADCSAEVRGETITLDVYGSWREPGSGACIDLCAALTATCVIENLPPGTYELRSGGHALKLSLPSEEAPALDPACPGA